MTDFPDKNKFLTPAQTDFILKRIEEDRGDSIPDKLDFKKVLHHLMDWKLWVYGAFPKLRSVSLLIVMASRTHVYDTNYCEPSLLTFYGVQLNLNSLWSLPTLLGACIFRKSDEST